MVKLEILDAIVPIMTSPQCLDNHRKRALNPNLVKSRWPIIHFSLPNLFWNVAKLQNDLTSKAHVLAERGFARFEFKMSFWRISYVSQRLIVRATQSWDEILVCP